MIIFHNLSTQLIYIFFPFLALESIIIVGLGHKKLEKRSNATKHFDFFLKNHYMKVPDLNTYKDVTEAHLDTPDLIEQFCTYLAKHATKYRKKRVIFFPSTPYMHI